MLSASTGRQTMKSCGHPLSWKEYAPRSDATLYALRRGIEKYGIPRVVYSDNGREFLTHDIGGRGFRKSADTGEHEPPTILRHLGIEFRTALVKNAKAKIIERAFREVKECFSRLFDGYTGGTIAERPERLKKSWKYASNFTLMEEFTGYVDTYIEGYFNKQPHKGDGMGGKTPDQVYAQCLYEQRMATPEQLNLMMLRNSRMVKVQRNGVCLKLYDKELYFNSDELLMDHIGEKVYFRYDPDHLDEVRVYDEKDRFLCTARQKGQLSYFACFGAGGEKNTGDNRGCKGCISRIGGVDMEQLYARGKPICPKSGYDVDNAAEKIKVLEDRAGRIQMILDEIVDRVTNRLLERTEIAEWARQAVKPSYTAEEVGADGEGSAQNALLEAKEYSDSTYQQSTAYTNQKIAELIGGADDTLDTLGEIADAIRNNETVVTALHNAIGNRQGLFRMAV